MSDYVTRAQLADALQLVLDDGSKAYAQKVIDRYYATRRNGPGCCADCGSVISERKPTPDPADPDTSSPRCVDASACYRRMYET